MQRDPELIRRDVQIATLMAENLQLRADLGVARAQAQAYELAESRDQLVQQRDAFAAELAAANREKNPVPPATPASGRPLVVDEAVPAAPAS